MIENLTKRQTSIMKLLTTGAGNDDMAASLGISCHTVKVHLWRLYKRLGVKSRGQATCLWWRAQAQEQRALNESLQTQNDAMMSTLIWIKANPSASVEAIHTIVDNALKGPAKAPEDIVATKTDRKGVAVIAG